MGGGLFDGRAIKVIEEEFILFKGVNIQEVFGREKEKRSGTFMTL